MNTLSSSTLNRTRTLQFLEGLTNSYDEDFHSLYLVPGLPSNEVEKAVKMIVVPSDVYKEVIDTTCRSKTGSIIFHSGTRNYLIIPPFPIRNNVTSNMLDTAPLLSLLETDYKIALIMVRLSSYAVGVFRGEKLISSKVGTGLVHGRHKKGGSSAHRFERHRDKQIEYFLTRVCQHTLEHLGPHKRSINYLVYGGARMTIQLLQKQCPFVGGLEIETLPPLLDIPEPRQAVLERVVSRIWSSILIEWVED
jgi:hypothetical protein